MNKNTLRASALTSILAFSLLIPQQTRAADSWKEWFWRNKGVAAITVGIVGAFAAAGYWWYKNSTKNRPAQNFSLDDARRYLDFLFNQNTPIDEALTMYARKIDSERRNLDKDEEYYYGIFKEIYLKDFSYEFRRWTTWDNNPEDKLDDVLIQRGTDFITEFKKIGLSDHKQISLLMKWLIKLSFNTVTAQQLEKITDDLLKLDESTDRASTREKIIQLGKITIHQSLASDKIATNNTFKESYAYNTGMPDIPFITQASWGKTTIIYKGTLFTIPQKDGERGDFILFSQTRKNAPHHVAW